VIFCVFVRGGVGWENGGGKGSGKRKRILLGVRRFGIDQVSCLGYWEERARGRWEGVENILSG